MTMKRFVFVPLLAAVLGAGCEDDPPTEPSPTIPTFTATLSPANEVPAITSVEATCSGNVTIRLNLTRDAAQVITAGTADITANITGCPQSTSVTIAHIHEQVAGQNGGIVVNTGISGGQVTLVSGAGSFTRNGLPPQNASDIALFQRMLDNPAGFYFNIHSTMHGGGFVRGQLVRTQ
jgi:CHRD domain